MEARRGHAPRRAPPGVTDRGDGPTRAHTHPREAREGVRVPTWVKFHEVEKSAQPF